MDAITSTHRELCELHRLMVAGMKTAQERNDIHSYHCDKYRAQGIGMALIAIQERMGAPEVA